MGKHGFVEARGMLSRSISSLCRCLRSISCFPSSVLSSSSLSTGKLLSADFCHRGLPIFFRTSVTRCTEMVTKSHIYDPYSLKSYPRFRKLPIKSCGLNLPKYDQRSGIYYNPFRRAKPVIIRSPDAMQELSEAAELSQRAVYADVWFNRHLRRLSRLR